MMRNTRNAMVVVEVITMALFSCVAGHVAAQTVKGVVVGQETGDPVAGALAVLQDSAGKRVAAGLAGADGRFELKAPGPGRYRLAAERIGYTTSYTSFFELGAGATLARTIVASVQAVSLEAITVTTGSRCRRQKDARTDVQKLWDEARKALTSVSLVEDAPRVSFRSVVWDRDLDPELGTVRREEQRPVFAMGDYPFRSPPADSLLVHGFVRGPVADTMTYYAPDAHVLLSDAFLNDYCFRAVKGDSGLIGLAFEPVPGGSRVTGVTGTLWLDAASAQLRRLEYGYVQLPIRPGKTQPGGELHMQRLGDGAVIVSSWTIRMPRFTIVKGALTDSVAYVHETGGRVMEVNGLDGPKRLATATGTLRGHILAESGAPLPRVLVYLSGTSHADTTDADGAFSMPDVWTGRYELAWYDRKHDPTAQHVAPRSVDVREGENDVNIILAGMHNAMYGGCPADERHPGLGVIVGVVREKATGVPLGGVGVKITGLRGRVQQQFTDRAGRFRFCWQPTGTYTLEASLEGFGSVRMGVRLGSLEVARRQLGMQVATQGAAGHHAGQPRLTGRVLDAGTGEPLSGVTVHVRGTKEMRITDDDGRFAFDDVSAGTVVLDASRQGYADATGSVTAADGQSLRLEIRMATRPVVLDPIVVTAVRARRVGLLADLQYRIKRGWGTFIQSDEIAVRSPRQLTDMLPVTAFETLGNRQIAGPGLRLINRRTQCAPQVYLDGVPITHFSAGDPEGPAKAAAAVNLVNPASVETIEIYKGASELPGEFGGSTGECGVIAIWTKRGPSPAKDTTGTP